MLCKPKEEVKVISDISCAALKRAEGHRPEIAIKLEKHPKTGTATSASSAWYLWPTHGTTLIPIVTNFVFKLEITRYAVYIIKSFSEVG